MFQAEAVGDMPDSTRTLVKMATSKSASFHVATDAIKVAKQ